MKNKGMYKNGKEVGYIVKPEEKIVIGLVNRLNLRGVGEELAGRLSSGYWNMVITVLANWPFLEKDIFDEDSPLKAVARCLETDEFSEKIGKEIVDTKLAYKYHLSMTKKYKQIIRNFKHVVNKCKELEREHQAYVAMYDEKLKKYL